MASIANSLSVIRIVVNSRHPVPGDETEMEALKILGRPGCGISKLQYLPTGQAVRVEIGPRGSAERYGIAALDSNRTVEMQAMLER